MIWHGQQKYFGGYFQDTWQVSQKLTLNMGLRYEYWRPWTLPRNAATTFDFSGEGSIVYALKNPLDVYDPATDYGRDAELNPNVPRQGYTTSNVNLAPRLGFAYTMTPNTVLRVAGGIFYAGNINTNQMSDNQSGGPPFTLQGGAVTDRTEQLPPIIVRNSFALPAPTSIPTAYSNPLPTARVLGEQYYPSPAVYQWSLGIQQRISASWAVNFDYIGSHTIHNSQWVQFNPGELPRGTPGQSVAPGTAAAEGMGQRRRLGSLGFRQVSIGHAWHQKPGLEWPLVHVQPYLGKKSHHEPQLA